MSLASPVSFPTVLLACSAAMPFTVTWHDSAALKLLPHPKATWIRAACPVFLAVLAELKQQTSNVSANSAELRSATCQLLSHLFETTVP